MEDFEWVKCKTSSCMMLTFTAEEESLERQIINVHIKAKAMLSPNTIMMFDNRSCVFASLNNQFLLHWWHCIFKS